MEQVLKIEDNLLVRIKATGIEAVEFEWDGHKFLYYVQVDNIISREMWIPAKATFRIIPNGKFPLEIQITALVPYKSD